MKENTESFDRLFLDGGVKEVNDCVLRHGKTAPWMPLGISVEVHNIFVGVDACPAAPDLMSYFVSLQEACTHASLNNLSFVVDYTTDNVGQNDLENGSPYYITFVL